MIKFIFDLDGTITSAETLPIISKNFNVHNEMVQLTRDTVSGKIAWKDSFIYRVNLLQHISVREIDNLLEKTPVYSMIESFIRENKKHCYIATGNLDCWIDKLCKKIGCQYYSSKAIVKNDEILKISHILEKANIVQEFQKNGHRVVFIGDSNNDVNAMQEADIAIAYGASHKPSNLCLSVADHVVNSEKELVILLAKITEQHSL